MDGSDGVISERMEGGSGAADGGKGWWKMAGVDDGVRKVKGWEMYMEGLDGRDWWRDGRGKKKTEEWRKSTEDGRKRVDSGESGW